MAMHDNELYKDFGALVKTLREGMRLTQGELADRVGLSRASIANIEMGRQKVALHQIYTFARHLNVSPEELLPSTENVIDNNVVDDPWAQTILRGIANG